MFRRILRSLTVLAALIAAYQAYVLLAVPLMDPPLMARRPSSSPSGPRPPETNPTTHYQLLLSNYFPKDHWSQTRPPKVFASSDEKAMLVLDDYKRHAEARAGDERFTQVDISRFALLVFPTPVRDGILPPRDTIILEAPQGARLKFDDFRPELGRIGQVTGGQFPGRITIRSDMREPGPEDDLLVETSELRMNTKLLYSESPVRFRMGQNVGGGRELEISFLVDEHAQPKDRGLKIAGIDTLEIRRDVRMRMQLETEGLLPGSDKQIGSHAEPATADQRRGNEAHQAAVEAGNEAPEKPSLPVEATCSGSFTFDFTRYVATLDRDVDLRQVNANGPGDQLFCNKLDIYFAPKSLSTPEPQPVVVDPSKRQQRDLGRLEPVAVEASGHPVVVNSPQHDARARGDRIQIALKSQRVRVAGTREATLVFGPNVLQAPVIDYQHPERDSATKIGRFRATGAGTLQYVPDPTKPDQMLRAEWQTMVDLSRENGQPVLTLEGRPQFEFAAMGALTADRMKIYLRELHKQGNTQDAVGIPISVGSGGDKSQITPDRIIASGNVDIESPRLTGRTGELLVAFHSQPAAAREQTPVSSPAEKPAESLADKLAHGLTAGPLQQVFHLSSDRMKLDVSIKGQAASPTTLSCDGNVVFREVPPPGTKEQPMEIRGAQLTVDRLDSTPYITLKGTKAAGITNGGPDEAQLSGRGVTMHINLLELDARENRMWSKGAGTATLLVTRDLQGQVSATPFPLDLTWQEGMQFDGTTMLFDRDVEVAGADDRMECDRLLAKLNTKIVFGQPIDQRAIDVSEIHCDGRVTINHLTRDAVGVTSHERAELARLSINQQTGVIHGVGPGVIRSTRFGDGLAVLAGAQNPAAPQLVAPPPGAAGSKLHFLRVDFHEGLTGSLILREVTFHKRVRAVYGPVDAWEQELDANRSEGLPPEAMTLSSDAMRINEDAIASRNMPNLANGQKRAIGYIQFQATGNVRIEGQEPKRGPFAARAERATYEEAKETFLLEGSIRAPATLWWAGQQGTPPSALSIRYVRSTGDFSVDKVQYLEFTPQDIEARQRPATVR